MTARLAVPLGLVAAAGILALLLGAPPSAALIGFFAALAALMIAEVEPAAVAPLVREPDPAGLTDADTRLVDAFPDPVLILAEGRIAAASAAARALLGDHVVGEDARVALRHPVAAQRLAAVNESADVVLVGLGGPETRWRMRVGAIGGGRRMVHLVDITGSHQIERMRVDFVANASHELRTPLAAILGFVETLSDDKAGGDAAVRTRFLAVIEREARRMERLVTELLSLSRIEAEKYKAPEQPLDLGELVREVCGVAGDGAMARGRDLGCAIEAGLPLVMGDRPQLSQLMHNLIGNALAYGAADTPVRVTLRRKGDGLVELIVADRGEGIAPEHLPRLTERFYRTDTSRSRAAGGTGLGLAIVKHIVERHRGRMLIESVQGEGTTVTVLLPAGAVTKA